jgi:ABC-2 type transport system permease protein
VSRNNGNSKNPLHGLWALTNRDLKKWYKNPIILMLGIIQPIIWMSLLGKAMNLGGMFTNFSPTLPPTIPLPLQEQIKAAMSDLSKQAMTQIFGTADYFSYMAVGMMSFVVMFTAMFSGMSMVFDRRLGFLNKVLSTPVARGSILMAKILSAVIRALVQATIVLGIAYVIGPLSVGANFTILNLLGVYAALFLISMGLSSIFILIAIRSTRQETQMAVVNLLNLPLMFASNALFPASLMPEWLQTITKINPVTYATDATRQLILYTVDLHQLAIDFLFLGAFAVVFSTIGIVLSWRYLSK